jgi:hypothetical protein
VKRKSKVNEEYEIEENGERCDTYCIIVVLFMEYIILVSEVSEIF